ncbi:LptF/LptG family permease [bacterium]|nr:LptF/LptG family permease [bacterium]
MFGILSRLILIQVISTFVMAQIAVTGLLVVLGALFEGPKTGLDPISILQVIPYIIAPSLPYTIPACLLFAVTSVFSAMSGSNEIVAVKAAGIDAMRLVRPVFTLALVVAIGCVALSDRVIPWCSAQLRMNLLGDLEKTLFTYIRQKGCIAGPSFPYELYVSDIDGTRLLQPIIKHRRESGGYDMVLQAREATLSIVPSSEVAGQAVIEMRLVDGALSTEPGNSAYFRDRTERLPLPDLVKGERLAVDDQDFAGLDQQAAKYRLEAEKARYEATIVLGSAIMRGDAINAAWPAQPILDKMEMAEALAYRSVCEKYQRISRSMSAIPFVILGCPVSIFFRRRDALPAFFICFLPIITIYYPTLILMYNFLKESQSEMYAVLWIPSMLTVLIAIPFIRQVIKH